MIKLLISKLSENRCFILFSVIGLCNTLVHTSFVVFFAELLKFNAILSNILAFFISNIASYLLNSKYTFSRQISYEGYFRFLNVSLFSLILVIFFSSMVELLGGHYSVSIILIVLVSPVLTYLLHNRFTFMK